MVIWKPETELIEGNLTLVIAVSLGIIFGWGKDLDGNMNDDIIGVGKS